MPKDKDRQQDSYDDEDDTRSTRGGSGMLHLSEELIPKFSGQSGVYSVTEWIQDIEDNGEIFQWSSTQRLLVARRSLTGTAALWLRAEKTFKSWEELQVAVSKEFPDALDSKTLHETLSSRRKARNESCIDYMLCMKALGRRGRLSDYVTIKYIIEGIEDVEINKLMLYGVKTFSDLKEKLSIYETIASKVSKTHDKQMQARSSGGGVYSKAAHNLRIPVTRCYSCGEKNHVAAECPHSSLGRKCFNCNEFGHLSAECPVRNTKMAAHSTTKIVTTVQSGNDRRSRHVGSRDCDNSLRNMDGYNCALIGLNSKMEDEVSTTCRNRHFDSGDVNKHGELQKIIVESKRPIKMVEIRGKTLPTLVDSGSDVNLMSKQCFSDLGLSDYDEKVKITMSGLGSFKVNSLGIYKTKIRIDGNSYSNVLFHVVPQQCMQYSLILGNDFLQNVVTVMKGSSVWMDPTAEWLYKVNCVACSSDCLGHVSNPAVKEEVFQLVEDYQPCQTKEAPIELHINMKDDVLVVQQPRRISLKEQEDVDKQINVWLQEENEKKTKKVKMDGSWSQDDDVDETRSTKKSKRKTDMKKEKSSKNSKLSTSTISSSSGEYEEDRKRKKTRRKKDDIKNKSKEIKMKRQDDIEIYEQLEGERRESFMHDRENLKKNFNKNRKESKEYKEGDIVAIKRAEFRPGLKLEAKYLGPYRVTEVKRNDRFDVEKDDPNAAADHMKSWPE